MSTTFHVTDFNTATINDTIDPTQVDSPARIKKGLQLVYTYTSGYNILLGPATEYYRDLTEQEQDWARRDEHGYGIYINTYTPATEHPVEPAVWTYKQIAEIGSDDVKALPVLNVTLSSRIGNLVYTGAGNILIMSVVKVEYEHVNASLSVNTLELGGETSIQGREYLPSAILVYSIFHKDHEIGKQYDYVIDIIRVDDIDYVLGFIKLGNKLKGVGEYVMDDAVLLGNTTTRQSVDFCDLSEETVENEEKKSSIAVTKLLSGS